MEFLRELFKLNEGFMPDLESMTDQQLLDVCRELGVEDACKMDAEGRLVNREQLIRDLERGALGDTDLDIPRDPPELEAEDFADADAEAYGYDRPADRGDDVPEGGEHDDLRYPAEGYFEGKGYTNMRKSFDFYKPVKTKEMSASTTKALAKVAKDTAALRPHLEDAILSQLRQNEITLKRRALKQQRLKQSVSEMETTKFKNPYTKLVTPAHGGLQKDVSNKSVDKAIEDEISDAGTKGMKKTDRPYMKNMRFRDWLTANMVFNMTKSGELAGNMSLTEAAKLTAAEKKNVKRTKENAKLPIIAQVSRNWKPTKVVSKKKVTPKSPVKEDAAHMTNVLWGTEKPKGFRQHLDRFLSLDWMFGGEYEDDYPKFNAKHTAERLKKQYGFDDETISKIRDIAVQGMKTAIEWGQRQFNIPDKYIATQPSSFSVYQLYLNIDSKVSKQVHAMARRLIARKLEKLNLNVPR
jgi:hypothetical protein